MRVHPVMPLLALMVQAAASQAPLTVVGAVALPGVEGRIDHLAYDPAAQRLFVAALGNNTVEVLDLKARRHLKTLGGFREPQGIAAAPDLIIVAVANGEGTGVQLLDAAGLSLTRSVALGDDADNVRYEAASKRIYVGYGAGALAAVSAADGTIVGQAKLAGHPESFQIEPSGRCPPPRRPTGRDPHLPDPLRGTLIFTPSC